MKPERSIFTLIELLVVVAIIIILISILLPSLKNAKNYAEQITCQNNIKQLATTMFAYVNDSDGQLPNPYTWPSAYKLYLPSSAAYPFAWIPLCPFFRCTQNGKLPQYTYYFANNGTGNFAVYGLNYTFRDHGRMNRVRKPSLTSSFADTRHHPLSKWYSPKGDYKLSPYQTLDWGVSDTQVFRKYQVSHRHALKLDSTNCGFTDGHLERVRSIEILSDSYNYPNFWTP